MDFVAKLVARNEFYVMIELFIEDLSILDGTRLLYLNGDIEKLNDKNSWVYQKVFAHLDLFNDLKENSIFAINDLYFDISYIEGAGEYNKEEMIDLLSNLDIKIDDLLKEGKEGSSLKKVHSLTKCLAMHFKEELDFSGTLAKI